MTADTDKGGSTPAAVSSRSTGRNSGALWIGLIFLLVLALGLSIARRHGELELELFLAGEEFVQGKPVMLSFAVKNTADREITVDAWERFQNDDPLRCKSFEGIPVELVLYYDRLSDPILRTPYESGDLGSKTLVPGEKLSFQCDIAYMFGLVKPGRYELRARYWREPWAHRPALAPLARLWSSLLEHDTVAFTVRSRIYDDKNTESKIRGDLR